jgi:ABC-2 type transport system ATP-binding protein
MSIRVEQISKSYGSKKVLDNVSFECPKGKITGFLGPNGSGKSTTMRVLSNLTPADGGRITIDGSQYTDLPNPGRRIGLLLDASAHHPGRTVYETVRLASLIIGTDRDRVYSVIKVMGLDTVRKHRVKGLSLGMRQRLGLAMAFLGQPDYLVLDEPANGLDVEGMSWLRGFLRGYAENGGTVLISSHLLQELQSFVDRTVIIDRGRIVSEGDISGIYEQAASEVSTPDAALLQAALELRGIGAVPGRLPGSLIAQGTPEQVGQIAWEDRIFITRLTGSETNSLERFYLGHTTGEFAAGDASALFQPAHAETKQGN